MKLIVNADDFGYSKGVNLGIMEAHREGIVTSTSLMANMPAAEHALHLAKHSPELGVGVHLVLDFGRPIRSDVPSLVAQDGTFLRLPDLLGRVKEEEIEREWQSQIERVIAAGISPTHLDSHHHVHAHPRIWPITCRLAERFQLPVRRPAPDRGIRYYGVMTTDQFFPDFYGTDVSLETVERILNAAGCGVSAEMMCHPGYVDAPLLAGSSYATERAVELAVLTDPRVRDAVQGRGVELITYREIATTGDRR